MANLPDELLMEVFSTRVPATVGRATIAWNNVSYAVYTLFEALSGLDTDSAKATFFCVQSDRSQRDMVSALIDSKLKPENAKLAKEAQTLIGSINGLAGRRNDILHIIFVDDHDPRIVKPFNKRGHIKNQEGDALLEAIHKLTIECLDMAKRILQLTVSLYQSRDSRRAVVKALLERTPQQGSEELASQGVFGLLGLLANIPQSPEGTQD